MSRRSPSTSRRAGLAAAAFAIAGAVVAVRARIRARTRSAPEPQTYTCRCGAEYRVSGADRHRVYWPAEAPAGAPVLGDSCPRCGAALPAEHASAVTVQPA